MARGGSVPLVVRLKKVGAECGAGVPGSGAES